MVENGTIERGKQDSYTFKKELGSGAYGDVWLAVTSDGTQVAVKVYHPGVSKENMHAIQSELEVLRHISADEQICRKYAICLLDYYYTNGAPRVVMEYINGESLQNYMMNLPLLERQSRNDIIVDLVRGMDEYHKLNVTHQDLKEDNIMWDTDARMARYIDWGLACLKKYCNPPWFDPWGQEVCRETREGGAGCGTSGTAYTMPPGAQFSQFNPKNFEDSKSHDIWSLGVVLLDWYTLPKGIGPMSYYTTKKIAYPPYIKTVLSKDAPPYWSAEDIKKKIATVNNELAKRVLPLLLEREPGQRAANWSKVMQEISNDFTSLQQCHPVIDSKSNEPWTNFLNNSDRKLEDIVTIAKPGTNQFWCFKKEDILNDPSYDPQLGSFVNPYTDERIFIDRGSKLALQSHTTENEVHRDSRLIEKSYTELVLQENNLETASYNYLTQILNLPELFSQCNQTVTWEQFYNTINTHDAKYEYLLPFFWVLTHGDYHTDDAEKNLLVPIILDDYTNVGWRFIFDTFSPTVTLSAVFRLMEQWIDNLIATEQVDSSSKQKLLCDYLTEFSNFTKDLNLVEVCALYLSDWNNIPKKKHLQSMLRLVAKYVNNTEKPLPLEWYMETVPRKRLFNQLGINWASGQKNDAVMTAKCRK